MRVTLTAAVTAATVIAGSFSVAMADDLNPPPWRGDPLSVHAEWDWVTAAPGNFGYMPPNTFNYWSGTADPEVGPNGEFLHPGFDTHSEVDLPASWFWDPGLNGIYNNTPGGLGIAFNVQNWVDLLPEKWLRIQVSYIDYIGYGDPTIDWVIGVEEPSNQYPGTFVSGHIQTSQYWYEDWIMAPNPDWEQIAIHVPETVVLHQVVIDTISIPAPATAALLGIGLLATRRRR